MAEVSIIMPVYNKAKYLSRGLQAILDQKFRDFELIIINDGSTDNSLSVIEDFAQKDSRVVVLDIPNGGVSHARNMGLDTAQGKYITFIDADDGIRSDYLGNLVRCIENSHADLVISSFAKVDDSGTILQEIRPKRTGMHEFKEVLPEFAAEQKESGIYGYCWSKIYSRSMFQNVRFDESLKLAEDFDFYLNFYEIISSVYFDDHPNYLYLQEAENSTGNIASEKIDFLAQLHINLHYRTVLRKRDFYCGENSRIVEGRLGDYSFFVLFHTPLCDYQERFEALYKVCEEEQIKPKDGDLLRRWLLFCMRRHLCISAKATIHIYRELRSLWYKIRN